MRQCPACSEVFDDAVAVCAADGAALGASDPLLGREIDGKYRLERRVASGGMGAVYKATQLNLGRLVAIKVLDTPLRPAPRARERFEREARAVARLKHPHIVTIFDTGVDARSGAYIVMEYLEGRSLHETLERRHRIPVAEAEPLIRQVCSAVHAAHTAGVVHRDLKPLNIFLEETKEGPAVKILDFGIAKLVEDVDADLTGAGALLGSPPFMSPEQCDGGPVSARSDVYSLGCVFYTMLTGRPPFVSKSAVGYARRHFDAVPEPPSAHAPEVPASADAAILRALAKDPESRFPSAADLAAALTVDLSYNRSMAADGPTSGAAVSQVELPGNLTRFVGRAEQLARVAATLHRSRLVTLQGSGGIGKTRLAVEVASAVAGSFRDGVRFVDLAPLSDPDLLPSAVARGAGVHEAPGRQATEALCSALAPRRLLLVLDNCEHLADACARLAGELLRSCPELRVLATSRQPLGVGGEVVCQVPPLAEDESVRLFADRARLSKAMFSITDRNVATVEELCRRLDGIPLAIELAAARIRVLPLEQILAKMSDRFRLLTSGGRTADARQQTLRATLDWSHDLLSEAERVCFRRLSVFAGGFTLDAAEGVVGNDECRMMNDEYQRSSTHRGERSSIHHSSFIIHHFEVHQHLEHLVEKSLVLVDTQGDEVRYGMLETIREYGLERLAEANETEEVRARHTAYFVALGERAKGEIVGPRQRVWFARLAADLDNFRLALVRSVREGRDPEAGLRLCAALDRLWCLHGHVREGRQWVGEALVRGADAPRAVVARALEAAGMLENALGDHRSRRMYAARVLEIWRELGDPLGEARALHNVGEALVFEGDYDRGEELCLESLAVGRAHGNTLLEAGCSISLGHAALCRGDAEAALEWYETALARCRDLGHTLGVTAVLLHLGSYHKTLGHPERALPLYEECYAMGREVFHKRLLAICPLAIAEIEMQQGSLERALELARLALENAWEASDLQCVSEALDALAQAACMTDAHERTLRLTGAAEGVHALLGYMPPGDVRAKRDAIVRVSREAFGPEAERALDEGRAMGVGQAVAYALE